MRRVLTRCFEVYGVPDAILVDHGVPWWHATSAQGLTRVTVCLLEQDIAVRFSGLAHPQTQGKVERFHRTLGRRLRQWGVPTSPAAFTRALARFRREYNDVRPHEALGQRPPATRYQPSPRRYQPRPRAWEYPRDHHVVRVSPAGTLRYRGHGWYLSEALAGRWVACRPLGDHALVAFRGHYLRELNLRTRQVGPVPLQTLRVLGMS